ncbi:MAG: hypothetical protein MJA83_15550 [Gammaproteobacteria bacterium]|nr:hypothetical protein [Gammaproteobacteria bacterium]
MNTQQEDQLAARAKQEFEQSVAELDAHVLSRLNRARQAAVQEAARSKVIRFRNTWAPAAVFTLAALAITTAVLWRGVPPEPAAEPDVELEILLSGENLELYEELEFYTWLDEVGTDSGG